MADTSTYSITQAGFLLAKANKDTILIACGVLKRLIEPDFNGSNFANHGPSWDRVAHGLGYPPSTPTDCNTQRRLEMRIEFDNLVQVVENVGNGKIGRVKRFGEEIARYF